MTKVVEEPGASTLRVNKTPVIDVDVHEMLTSVQDLVPYLEPKWQRYITDCGWQGTRQVAYVQHLDGGVDRVDAKPSNGGPGGSDYVLMREQLLDKYNIERAVLTGLFYPSTMKTQFEFSTAVASAYNDWLINNWLEKDSRFLGSIHVAAQEPQAAAREIDRVGQYPSMVQVMLPIGTLPYGEPFFHPIFEAAERNNLLVAMHHSHAAQTALDYPRYYIEWHTAVPQSFMSQVISLVSHGVFTKFPNLRLVLLEGGFTWVPHLMWRFDQNYKSLRREVPWLTKMPSQIIRDHIRCATQPIEGTDPIQLINMVEMIGDERFLLFSSDYPHWDFDSPERALSAFPKDARRRILYDNAKELYGL